MHNKFSQGYYIPENPQKYVGSQNPRFMSSWERKVFIYLDRTSSIISWASEPIKIPYWHPIENRPANYMPDLLIKSIDRNGKEQISLVEIKPFRQTIQEAARSKKEKIDVIVNTAKWKAAQEWAKQHGCIFRVITEKDIFITPSKKK